MQTYNNYAKRLETNAQFVHNETYETNNPSRVNTEFIPVVCELAGTVYLDGNESQCFFFSSTGISLTPLKHPDPDPDPDRPYIVNGTLNHKTGQTKPPKKATFVFNYEYVW